MTVINLEEYRPHLLIPTGNVMNVVPVALVEKWIAGEIEPPEDIVRWIISDWLKEIVV